ncbi:MAG: hypothetical protein DHS20C18_41730 [Saprospiraceae bacterium]|nr:MAG: hypothetical protein DHS20C18_41730 [Saprospiraceae bacterium]
MLIQTYNPIWKQHFETIKEVLQSALHGHTIAIEHIGSTSVPGLAAKPIIDIDIVFPADAEFIAIKTDLSKIGYYHNGDQGIANREAFKRNEGLNKHPVLDEIEHHLYVCPADSQELHRHLLFRNYLRRHNWAREEYGKLKYALAKETNQDRKAYALLKELRAKELVESIINRAKEQIK